MVQLLYCLPGIHEALGRISSTTGSVMTHAYSPCTQVGVRGSEVQGHYWLHSKSEVILRLF